MEMDFVRHIFLQLRLLSIVLRPVEFTGRAPKNYGKLELRANAVFSYGPCLMGEPGLRKGSSGTACATMTAAPCVARVRIGDGGSPPRRLRLQS
jgi:hypothetical protein